MAEKQPNLFGRTPRSYSPRIPHLSALVSGATPSSPPDTCDYTSGMPEDFGDMLNNEFNNCTCAAYYHARQVWTFQAQGSELLDPDRAEILKLYSEACGYNPNSPPPGPGGNAQHVLTYLLNYGAPIGTDGAQRDRLLAFVELDSRNIEDVKRVIYDCGVVYVGFPVPQNVTKQNRTWDYDPSVGMTAEGHAVILAGYDTNGAIAISWGTRYVMTWPFVVSIVDEAYALADDAWIKSGGSTPVGMSLSQLESQMQALKYSDLGTPFAVLSGRSQPPEARRTKQKTKTRKSPQRKR